MSDESLVQKFARSLAPRNKRERTRFQIEMFQLDLMHEVSQYLKTKGIKERYLADKLGLSRKKLIKLFTAEKLLDMKTIARIQEVLGCKIVITLKETKGGKDEK